MTRIIRGSPATLSASFYDDEQALDAGNVTVTITRADGTQLTTGPADNVATGQYAFTLPGQDSLNVLTVEWAGDNASQTTYAEIVGGTYFSIPELRAFDPVLANTTKYPTSVLRGAREAVEAEFEGICGRAFVPRYYRETLWGDGNHQLWLSKPEPLNILSLLVDGDDWSAKTIQRPDDNLRVIMLPGFADIWPRQRLIVIEYEYGMADVPIRIKQAALKRAKYSLVSNTSRIDERATVMNVPDFGNFVLATPGIRGSYTGIPEVDVVLNDYAIGSL